MHPFRHFRAVFLPLALFPCLTLVVPAGAKEPRPAPTAASAGVRPPRSGQCLLGSGRLLPLGPDLELAGGAKEDWILQRHWLDMQAGPPDGEPVFCWQGVLNPSDLRDESHELGTWRGSQVMVLHKRIYWRDPDDDDRSLGDSDESMACMRDAAGTLRPFFILPPGQGWITRAEYRLADPDDADSRPQVTVEWGLPPQPGVSRGDYREDLKRSRADFILTAAGPRLSRLSSWPAPGKPGLRRSYDATGAVLREVKMPPQPFSLRSPSMPRVMFAAPRRSQSGASASRQFVSDYPALSRVTTTMDRTGKKMPEVQYSDPGSEDKQVVTGIDWENAPANADYREEALGRWQGRTLLASRHHYSPGPDESPLLEFTTRLLAWEDGQHVMRPFFAGTESGEGLAEVTFKVDPPSTPKAAAEVEIDPSYQGNGVYWRHYRIALCADGPHLRQMSEGGRHCPQTDTTYDLQGRVVSVQQDYAGL